jgi:hypothetical protein
MLALARHRDNILACSCMRSISWDCARRLLFPLFSEPRAKSPPLIVVKSPKRTSWRWVRSANKACLKATESGQASRSQTSASWEEEETKKGGTDIRVKPVAGKETGMKFKEDWSSLAILVNSVGHVVKNESDSLWHFPLSSCESAEGDEEEGGGK